MRVAGTPYLLNQSAVPSVAMAPGSPGRAAWLCYAGERWEMVDDFARARACFEEAVAEKEHPFAVLGRLKSGK